MERLGHNRGGYRGETILPEVVIATCELAAADHGWTRDSLAPDRPFRPAYQRRSRRPSAPRIYLSAGIHGDEPAGPLAMARLLRDNAWPDADLWLVPCLNPEGLRTGRRENEAGFDLNRDYRASRCPETRGHVDWFRRQPDFDLTLLLHEDWESHGFYIYEVNRSGQPSLAPQMISAVRAVCPVDESPVIDGRDISEPGILRPLLTPEERPDWPEALWLITHKAPLSYTLEAPSDWPLTVRTDALVVAIRTALASFLKSET